MYRKSPQTYFDFFNGCVIECYQGVNESLKDKYSLEPLQKVCPAYF